MISVCLPQSQKKWVLTEEGKPGGTFLTFFACKGSARGKQYISSAFILEKFQTSNEQERIFPPSTFLVFQHLEVSKGIQG